MIEKIFGLILVGVLLLIGIALLIKFAIWSYKTDKEIEEMEEELNRRREAQEKMEEEFMERWNSLTKKEKAKLSKEILEALVIAIESTK